MDLKDRIRVSLAKRPGHVVLRRELNHFGSATQLSHVLLGLQKDGVLTRIGEGIYAKPVRSDSGAVVDVIRNLAMEALRKVGIQAQQCDVTDREIVVRVAGDSRRDRRLAIEGRPVRFQRTPRFQKTVPANVHDLPTQRVDKYVRELAAAHHVSYERSGLDAWAEGVTRAAGDQVRTDNTHGLLVRLKQRKVLDDRQFTQLLVNHHREARRV